MPTRRRRLRRALESALMAQVDDTVSLVGYVSSGVLALYLFWKIVRTPGDL